MNLNEMREQYAELTARITELQNLDEKTGDAAAELDESIGHLERLAGDIERAERLEAVQNKMSEPVRKTRPDGSTAKKNPSAFPDDNAFFRAVADAGIRNQVDPRLLRNTAGDIQQESVGADGGYVVPVDKRALQTLLVPPDSVAGRCDPLLTTSNAVTLPIDDDAVWSTSLAAAAVAEGGTLTETKGGFKSLTVSLAKQGVLVRITSEMLEDGTNIGPYVLNKTAQKLRWAIDKICWTAFLASGAKVSLTGGTTGRTASAGNPILAGVQKMWISMLPEMRANAVWMANPQLETVLQGYSVGNVPVYIPAGGISQAPYSTLYGRPVIFSELCPAVGVAGDITLVDPSSYFLAMKSTGPRTDVSIHSEFAKDVVGYRSYVRVACASKFSAVITRGDGSSTAGNVVVIAP